MKIISKDEPIGLDIDEDGNISAREVIFELVLDEDEINGGEVKIDPKIP